MLIPPVCLCVRVLQFLQVTFDPNTGLLSSLSNLETKQTISLTQNFYWSVRRQQTMTDTFVSPPFFLMCLCACSRYNASDGKNSESTQPSGAYIFRPNSSTPFVISNTAKTESIQVENSFNRSFMKNTLLCNDFLCQSIVTQCDGPVQEVFLPLVQ